jgi:pyroglutamyl-peptidase
MRRSICLLAALALGCGGDSDLLTAWVELQGRVGFELDEDLTPWLDGADGSWTTSDPLPPGLELTEDGRLRGTPLASGAYGFDVSVEEDGDERGVLAVDLSIPTLVLLSGYEPFGGAETNPSIEALWPLQEALIAKLDLRVIEVPVVWDEAWDVLREEIDLLDPDIVISTGQAGSDRMRFEINAVNIQNGTDNDGVTRSGEEVVEGGPDALGDRLPEDVMSAAMEASGFATTISDDAGEYLCNDLFYHLMYHAEVESERDDLVAGFIHVSPAGQYSSYSVEDITAAHMVGLEALSAWYDAGAVLRGSSAATEHRAPIYDAAGAPR